MTNPANDNKNEVNTGRDAEDKKPPVIEETKSETEVEMEGFNPKNTPKDQEKELPAASQGVMQKIKGFLSASLAKIKAAPGKSLQALKAIYNAIINSVKKAYEAIKTSFFSKEGIGNMAGKIRPFTALIAVGGTAWLAATYAIAAVGLVNVVYISACVTAVAYGLSKLPIKESTGFSVTEMFNPAA
jgi:hypothetical protein